MTESETPKTGGQTSQTCGQRVFQMFAPPADAGEHFRQARLEFLKGIRALVDHQIEKVSTGPMRGTRVNVE